MGKGSSAELAAEGVSLAYNDGERTTFALREVTLTLPAGRLYGIMGPSGSGKSSLLYILSGLKPPTAGAARFGDFVYRERSNAEVTALRRARFGFVFQQPFLLPYLTALENAVTAAPKPDLTARDRARDLLREMGLGGMENKLPSQLSGGEKQRVSVVRAMMNDPDVIFADEPTAALDHRNGHRVVEALATWRARGTVVIVTHDPEMVRNADEVVLLRDGMISDVK
ncbi:MAG: ABC transporter ATP-binding protein [Capsulimonadales bacterium]|nr:ABC transporter ATP-binding protein [Capsulimonadales bacterium]